MDNKHEATQAEVTQADRDAAADLFCILHDVWPGYTAAHATREGDDDLKEVVQAFARHRIAHTPDTSTVEDEREELRFVFDGPPGPECGRFVECETPDGRSVNAGTWHDRGDGYWELRVSRPSTPDTTSVEDMREACAKVAESMVHQDNRYPWQVGWTNAANEIAAAIRSRPITSATGEVDTGGGHEG